MRYLSVPFLSLVVSLTALAWAENTESNPVPANTATPSATKVYHDRSVRDLDAIGNRNVGCGRGLGNWYSLDKQIAMGKEYA